MLKYILLLAIFITTLSSTFGQEPGMPLFSDSFNTTATFAENWVPQDKQISSENGKYVGSFVFDAPAPIATSSGKIESFKPLQIFSNVNFTLPAGLKYEDNAEIMFEDRIIPVTNGHFTDSFNPHSRHVYKIKIIEL